MLTIQSMSEQQISTTVSDIIASLDGDTERDFQMASLTYNSEFFKGLPDLLVQQACQALNQHFMGNTNNFWVKKAQQTLV